MTTPPGAAPASKRLLRLRKLWFHSAAAQLAWMHLGISAICCTVPLFDGLGYEYALVTTLAAALWSPGLGLAHGRFSGWQPASLLRALSASCGVLLPGLVLLLLHGLRVPPCNLVLGLTFFALMPVGSAVTGAGMGWALGALTCSWRGTRAWAALACLQALSLAAVLARLYFEPPIVLFDPLWGYFAGSLYDEAIEVPQALWAIRATTLWATLTLWVTARANGPMRPSLPVGGRQRARLLAIVASVLLLLQVRVIERTWGSRIDRSAIEAVLCRTEAREGIVVHLPADISPEVRASLADEHAYRLRELTARMQLEHPPTLHSYVYANAAQKAALMGGGQTMVAKPWLRQVHIHGTDVPHPLLAHELVHALAGVWAPGPLHVSARFGLLVNMGLTEGLATALAPDGLGPDLLTSARALYTMGLQVPLQRLLGGAGQFWQLAPARAYSQAGALLRFIEARYGIAAVQALYGSSQTHEVLGIGYPQLERDFAAWLQVDETPQPPSFAQARAQLQVPSIFARVCPHEVARLRQRAAAAPPAEAPARWRDVLRRTGAKKGSTTASAATVTAPPQDRLAWARAAFSQGDESAAIQEVGQVVHMRQGDGAAQARAKVLWAQLAARHSAQQPHPGDASESGAEIEQWHRLCTEAVLASPWRGIDREAWLTRWALEATGSNRQVLLALIMGDSQALGRGAAAASVLMGLDDGPSAHYLWGRLLLREGATALAYPHLSDSHQHPYGPIDAERRYLAAQTAYRLGAWAQAAHHARSLGPPGGVEPYWGWATDVLHRAETELSAAP